MALKEIWLALDGKNWSFYGEEYPAGSNWDFNKDIDMWGNQPGVTLNAEGRVENLNLSGFGAKGVVPDAIGQLTDLKLLYLGNHNELIGGYDSSERVDARDYYKSVLQRDARKDLSSELKSVINRDASQRPIVSGRVERRDVAFGNLTNGITGISRQMMRLTKLEQFFIANAPITTEGFFVGQKEESLSWANFTNLMDVEIYNCPNLTALPRELITELPNIQSLNVAMNYGISGAQLKADWEALIDGKSGGKVQILYLGFNNLEETPSYDKLRKMSKIGLLDCNSNKLRVIHPFGKEVCPTTLIYDYNRIESIYPAEDGYFCGLNQLEDFTCSNNNLTALPDLFTAKSVYSMISMDFSSNDIAQLQNGEAWRGVNTQTLNLADNKFSELPKRIIGSGSKIETLMLSSNGMRKIEKGALIGAGSEYLTTIDLSFNRLSELPYEDFSISNIPFLYGIDLSSNAFEEVPYSLLTIDRLTVISIRQQRDDEGNRTLSVWPEGIGKHKSLAALYIGSNNLGKINDTISPYILLFEIKDNPNISIDLSNVCPYIEMGYYELIYDSTQDIRGCDALNLD
jgi:Leucine-rich repeat (LRR) protein